MNTKLLTTGLSWIAVAGVAITGLLSAKCAKKAEEAPDAKGKLVAYSPAIISGIGTAACILTSNHINQKTIAGLAASCAYLTANRDRIQKKLEDISGKDDAAQMRSKIDQEAIAPWEGPSIEWTGNGQVKFLEGYSGRLFYSSWEAVKEAEDTLNEAFCGGEYVSLNDFYKLLGIQETHFGEQFGWAANSDYYSGPIEFINTMTTDPKTGEHLGIIEIYTYPMECWQEV